MKSDPKMEEELPSEEEILKWMDENADILKQMAFDRCYAFGKEPNEVTEEDVRKCLEERDHGRCVGQGW